MALTVKNLKVHLPSFALSVDALSVTDGEIVSIIGPSGSGKSTLLLAISGFINSIGSVESQRGSLDTLPSEKRGIGLVFQRPALIPHLNVIENVELGLKVKRIPRDEMRGLATQALKGMQIEGLALRKPSGLSGGEAQRVMLARVLVLKLPIVLFDEPFGAMDPPLRRDFRILIKKLMAETGTSAVMVTHDPQDLTLSRRVLVLEKGAVSYRGTIAEGRNECSWLRSFLGA